MIEEYKAFRVVPYVRDAELEKVLNEPGWAVFEMFRNSPGSDGLETTTCVQIREECDNCWPAMLDSSPTTTFGGDTSLCGRN